MGTETLAVQKPQRWDHPLAEDFDDADLLWLMRQSPFSKMLQSEFPKGAGVREILRNDSRIVSFSRGDVVLREGAYSGNAYLVLDGSVRVFNQQLAIARLPTVSNKKLSYWQALRAFWKANQPPERRLAATQSQGEAESDVGVRKVADEHRVFIQDVDRVLESYGSGPLGTGEIFGEIAAITRAPCHYTVLAESDCSLLEIRWQGLRMFRRSAYFRNYLDTIYRNSSLLSHLREIKTFEHVPEEELRQVASVARLRSIGELEWYTQYRELENADVQQKIASEPIIVEEGNTVDSLILIRSGFARESVKRGGGHRTVAYHGKGGVFGWAEFFENERRHARHAPLPYQTSLRAVGFVDVIEIPTPALREYVLPYVRKSEQVSTRNLNYESDHTLRQKKSSKRSSKKGSKHSEKSVREPSGGINPPSDQTGLNEFLVDSRMINGQQAMLIDTLKCTRCDDCVTACAATHDGNSRFVRHGPSFDGWMFAQACMHCADPVCMLGCPTGAIHRERDTGVVSVNPMTCIGCSTCANSCPYDNIKMVEIRDPSGRRVVDKKSQLPILQATKCDMCHSMPSGPACVAACPHDALFRVDLSDPKSAEVIHAKRG